MCEKQIRDLRGCCYQKREFERWDLAIETLDPIVFSALTSSPNLRFNLMKWRAERS